MTGRTTWARLLVAVLVTALVSPAALAQSGVGEAERPGPTRGTELPPEPVLQEEAETERPEGTVSMVASAAYPGLGQLLNGTETKAAIVSAVELALIAGLVVEDRRTRNAFRLYKQTGELRYYDEYSEHYDNRQTLVWWVAIAVLYGLADAYVDAHLAGFEDARSPFVDGDFGVSENDGGIRLGLAVRF